MYIFDVATIIYVKLETKFEISTAHYVYELRSSNMKKY